MFGNPETTTGGNALKFYASVRMDVRRIQAIKEGQDVVGSRTRVRVVKNKVAPPFREAEFDIMYNEGISKTGDLIDLGATLEIITKRGAFYTFNDSRIGQGRENAKRYLGEHPEMAAEIEKAIRAQVLSEGGMPTGKPKSDDDSDEDEE
jgi:recombination protein RecA